MLCFYLTSVDMLLREGLSAPDSRIVFTSTRHRNADIFVMDADGGNQERLTINNARDGNPSWSPDRTQIAFVSDRGGGGHEIYVMDARGKGAIKLTDGPRRKGHLDWSPDGEKIAFTSWEGQKRTIWRTPYITVMDADGKNPFKLTDGKEPSWSPDGQRIAFASGYDWDDQIFLIDADGGRRERVTKDTAIKGSPAWSPDGKRIAYMTITLKDEFFQIYVIGADGRNRVRLTHNLEDHFDPTWSPDGRMIAYVWSPNIHPHPPAKIRLMTADGKYLKQLTGDQRGNEYHPDFGPVSLAVSPTSNIITVWGRLKSLAPNLR